MWFTRKGGQSPPHSLHLHWVGWAEELCKVACALTLSKANPSLPVSQSWGFPRCLTSCCSPSPDPPCLL